MVYNILGHIAGFFFSIIIVCFLCRLAWLMIPKLLRDVLTGTFKGIYAISQPVRVKSKEIHKDIQKANKKKKKAKKVAMNKKKSEKSAMYKDTKHSHLKIVK